MFAKRDKKLESDDKKIFAIIKSNKLAEREKCDKIKRILQQNPEIINNKMLGLSPFQTAVKSNLPEVIKLLLQLTFHEHELFEIIKDNKLTEDEICMLIKLLVEKDPEILLADWHGFSPLHIAVLADKLEVVKLLLKMGISVNILDSSARTPLHIAVEKGLPKMILLLGYDPLCNFNLVDSNKRSVLHNVIFYNRDNCVECLINLFEAIKLTPLDENKPSAKDILHQDFEGRTALHLAAQKGIFKLLLTFLGHDGTDVNIVDRDGNTALHLCIICYRNESDEVIKKNYQACVKILTEKTDKSIKNKEGFTPEGLINLNNKEKTNVLKNVVNIAEEDFYIFNYETPNKKFKEHLAKKYKGLEESLEESRNKEFQRTSKNPTPSSQSTSRRKSLVFFNFKTVSSSKKEKHNISRNNTSTIDTKTLEQFYLKKENKKGAAELIRELQGNEEILSQILNIFVEKHHDKKANDFLDSVLEELKCLNRSSFRRKIAERGLKLICSPNEINQIKIEDYSKITYEESTIKQLQKLTEICSGKIIDNEAFIDLKSVALNSLGMMDFVEPTVLIENLRKLSPLFSNIQRLLSHHIVFTLIDLYEFFYGSDNKEKEQFTKQVQLYLKECCDDDLSNCLIEYLISYPIIKTKILNAINEKPEPIQSKKEDINTPINEFVRNFNGLYVSDALAFMTPDLDERAYNNFWKHVINITDEFSIINTIFLKECLLKDFRLECWDAEKNPTTWLTAYSKLINLMSNFVTEKIYSFSTEIEQANAITLFTLVARELLLRRVYSPAMAISGGLSNVDTTIKKGFYAERMDNNMNIIREALSNLMDVNLNFKNYRELLAIDKQAFPAIQVLFPDKNSKYGQGVFDSIGFFGEMYKGLIIEKKRLHNVNSKSKSNLLELIEATPDELPLPQFPVFSEKKSKKSLTQGHTPENQSQDQSSQKSSPGRHTESSSEKSQSKVSTSKESKKSKDVFFIPNHVIKQEKEEKSPESSSEKSQSKVSTSKESKKSKDVFFISSNQVIKREEEEKSHQPIIGSK
jgi:ankyrin repeat protein